MTNTTQTIEQRITAFLEPGSVRHRIDKRGPAKTPTWTNALRRTRAALKRGETLAGNTQLITYAQIAVGEASSVLSSDPAIGQRFGETRKELWDALYDLEQDAPLRTLAK